MIADLTNHLWQSTLFAVAAGLLTLAFRKNRAQVRYWLWFSASFKFFIPFALLLSLGSHLNLEWRPVAPKNITQVTRPVASLTLEFTEPFPVAAPATPAKPGTRDWAAVAIAGLWMSGFLCVALTRFRGWLRIRAAVRASAPIEVPLAVEARSCPGLLEPGVVGLLRPILLLPAGIEQRLPQSQLEAVFLHELCHVRRRDNLTSAIHMIVEAVFWFHPLVWWIGARLVEERERACDEEVLSLGSEPQVYASGILNVCKLYMESPLACVSGVTGSNLKKRIEAIMANDIVPKPNLTKKVALAVAGMAALAAPIVVGIMNAPAIRAQSSSPKLRFEVAAIKPCPEASSGGKGGGFGDRGRGWSPGRLNVNCTTVTDLITWAYVSWNGQTFRPGGLRRIEGGPSWVNSDRFQIEAKTDGSHGRGIMMGPMMQSLLEDRFELKVHRETREAPVFELSVTKGGAKLTPAKDGSCFPFDFDNPPPPPPSGQPFQDLCGVARHTQDGLRLSGATMADFCRLLSNGLDRPIIDKTGIAGKFDFHLELTAADLGIPPRAGDPAAPDAAAEPAFSPLFSAIQKLGLKLTPAKGPAEFLVIDHVEKPSAN
jgi:bla regulator protein BlaR1